MAICPRAQAGPDTRQERAAVAAGCYRGHRTQGSERPRDSVAWNWPPGKSRCQHESSCPWFLCPWDEVLASCGPPRPAPHPPRAVGLLINISLGILTDSSQTWMSGGTEPVPGHTRRAGRGDQPLRDCRALLSAGRQLVCTPTCHASVPEPYLENVRKSKLAWPVQLPPCSGKMTARLTVEVTCDSEERPAQPSLGNTPECPLPTASVCQEHLGVPPGFAWCLSSMG